MLEQGIPREVLEIAPLGQTKWDVTVYVDLPASRGETVAAFLDAVGATAESLLRSSRVRVVVARTLLDDVLPPTDDLLDLEAALDHVRGSMDDAGDLAETRIAGDGEPSEQEVLDAFFEEEELLRWQDELLADGLLRAATPAQPRAVLLVRDLVDQTPRARAEEAMGDRGSVRFEPRLRSSTRKRHEQLERTLAAAGIYLFPFEPPAPGDQDGSDTSEPASPAARWALASGGATWADAADLAEIIRTFDGAAGLTYRTDPRPIGEPYPVDVRTTPPRALHAPRWATTVSPDGVAASLARRFLQEDEQGALELEASYLVPEGGTSFLETLVRWPGGGAPPRSDALRVTLVRSAVDLDPEIRHTFGNGTAIESAWLYRMPIDDPEAADLALIVEDLDQGLWGAAHAEPGSETLLIAHADAVLESEGDPPPVPEAVRRAALPPEERGRGLKPPDLVGEPPPQTTRAASELSMLKIVPPRSRRLAGKAEFKILLTNLAVDRVAFYLDGQPAGEDTRRPFQIDLDLGPDVRPHRIAAVAYSGQGLELDRDEITVNPERRRQGIRITEASPAAGGAITASAELSIRGDGPPLDRVELYRNESLIATFTRPPFRTTLPGPGRADADYVRAVAYLRDGTFLEDVRLLGSDALSEQVEVNLVEIYAVVTDANGDPVQGLQASDFEVTRKGDQVPVDRFAVADQAALDIGLVVDTSFSMYSLMPDTRKAAATFLQSILTPIDEAFLIDFDNRPRLAHPKSARLASLLDALGSLRAGGATALYDSVLFAVLHFDQGLGRKALVLLTDGDDSQSQFSYRRIYQTASVSGLPIYFIALGGLDEERPSFRKQDLESLARVSGGRVFYPTSMADVGAAYATIGEELRSQYVLGLSTAEALEDEELEQIKVKVLPRGLKVRYVVGAQ